MREATGETRPPPGRLPPRYWRVVTVLSLFALANFSDTFLILRAKDLGLGFAADCWPPAA